MINNKDIDILINANIDSYPLFSLNGLETHAKLLSNYDGDTGDILFIYNETPMRMKARFTGYDTCEIKPSLKDPLRDDKKKRALEAKQRLWFLCTNTTDFKSNHKTLIKIKCHEFDKYGRILITAFRENEELSINQQMINEGHGYAYDGGTKNNLF
jgi:endonuclease YncB( thermonuclease family)